MDIKPPFVGGEIELNNANVIKFYYIESIENMFMTGFVEIEDVGGFFEKLPLTGEETLRVTIEQDIIDSSNVSNTIVATKTIDFEFFIIELKENEKQRTTNYLFKLVEKGFFDFVNKAYSKSYNQQKIDDILTDVCKNQLKLDVEDYDIERTDDKIDFIIPYWKPLITIKHLIRKAKRQKAPRESGFLFFSTSGDDTTLGPVKKFVSFATLLEEKADRSDSQIYYQNKQDINPNYLNNFLEMQNPFYKNRRILKDGISGKTFYGVNLKTDKTLLDVNKKFSEYISGAKSLGTNAFLKTDIDDIHGEVMFLGYTSESQIEAHQDHKFRMSYESFNKREVLLNGSLERYCGKLIYVEQISDNIGELHNIENSGEWLIKAITHNFLLDVYEQKLIIIKDAYSDTELEDRQSL